MGAAKRPNAPAFPLINGPTSDRRRWLNACAASDLLDDEVGARSSHAQISNTKAAKGYGRWLTHLSRSAPETLTETPATRITSEGVRGYVDAMKLLDNSSQTILARLQELGEVAKVMDPERDWSFINRMASKVRARHRPVRAKTNLRLSNELVDLGFKLIQSANDLRRTRRRDCLSRRSPDRLPRAHPAPPAQPRRSRPRSDARAGRVDLDRCLRRRQDQD